MTESIGTFRKRPSIVRIGAGLGLLSVLAIAGNYMGKAWSHRYEVNAPAREVRRVLDEHAERVRNHIKNKRFDVARDLLTLYGTQHALAADDSVELVHEFAQAQAADSQRVIQDSLRQAGIAHQDSVLKSDAARDSSRKAQHDSIVAALQRAYDNYRGSDGLSMLGHDSVFLALSADEHREWNQRLRPRTERQLLQEIGTAELDASMNQRLKIFLRYYPQSTERNYVATLLATRELRDISSALQGSDGSAKNVLQALSHGTEVAQLIDSANARAGVSLDDVAASYARFQQSLTDTLIGYQPGARVKVTGNTRVSYLSDYAFAERQKVLGVSTLGVIAQVISDSEVTVAPNSTPVAFRRERSYRFSTRDLELQQMPRQQLLNPEQQLQLEHSYKQFRDAWNKVRN